MDTLQATKLARKAYCDATPICKTKDVVIQHDPIERYKVICPVDELHPLKVAKSQFTEWLEAWRRGTLDGTGIEGLIFGNQLRSMARKEERWKYDLDERGRITRIGSEWAPWVTWNKVTKEESMTGKELVIGETRAVLERLNARQVREFFCAKATDAEVALFLQVCKATDSNPFLREAWLIKYQESEPAAIVIAKDRKLRAAEEEPHYTGHKAGIITIQNGNPTYVDGSFLYPGVTLVGGWAEIYRSDRATPIRMEVSLSECIQRKRDGTPTHFWKDSPAMMIRKVALSRALSEAFPTLARVRDISEIRDAEALPNTPITVDRVTGEILGPEIADKPLDWNPQEAAQEPRETASDAADGETPASEENEAAWAKYQDHRDSIDALLNPCPIHGKEWKPNRYGAGHSTANKYGDPGFPETASHMEGTTVFCNRSEALKDIISMEARNLGMTAQALAEEMKARFNNPPSKLTDEERAEIILWLRSEAEKKAMSEVKA